MMTLKSISSEAMHPDAVHTFACQCAECQAELRRLEEETWGEALVDVDLDEVLAKGGVIVHVYKAPWKHTDFPFDQDNPPKCCGEIISWCTACGGWYCSVKTDCPGMNPCGDGSCCCGVGDHLDPDVDCLCHCLCGGEWLAPNDQGCFLCHHLTSDDTCGLHHDFLPKPLWCPEWKATQ